MLFLLLLACADVVQTPDCATYVSCIQARDAIAGTSTDLVRFQPEGECWGTPAGADLCGRACTNGLAFLREREPALPAECSP